MYNYAKRNFSDVLYYFILDGLMMFSALLMLVFRIWLFLTWNRKPWEVKRNPSIHVWRLAQA